LLGNLADQANPYAERILGIMYVKGQGVPQDYVQAYKWFELSAAHGYKDAIQTRQVATERMTNEQIAEAQKLAREWKPTRQPVP